MKLQWQVKRIPEDIDETAIPWLKISSGTKVTNQEILEAIESRRDFDLRRVAEIECQKHPSEL